MEIVADVGQAYAFRVDVAMGLTRNTLAITRVEVPEAVAAMRGMAMVRPEVAAFCLDSSEFNFA